MRWLLGGSWMEAGNQKVMIRSLKFLASPLIFWQERGAGNKVYDQLCLHVEASIKIPEEGIQKASRLVNTFMYPDGATPQLQGTESSCTGEPYRLCLMYLFIWLFICILHHILYYKIKWQTWICISKSLMNHASKWLNSKRESRETLICSVKNNINEATLKWKWSCHPRRTASHRVCLKSLKY